MTKPTIADLLPGSTMTDTQLVIPVSLFLSAGLDSANFTSPNGSKIIAALLMAIQSSLDGKDDNIDYSIVKSSGFDSLSTRSDNISYEVKQINFSAYIARPNTVLDPDSIN